MSGAGFGRELRLLSAADFKAVFSQPKRSKDACFTVLARANASGRPRLGLAIAKKHVRLSVARNRIKRLVRESFRRHSHELQGLDIVVLAHRGTAGKSNSQLTDSLSNHWRRMAPERSGDSVSESP
jgi:ribonuclease P protein component